jgi:hypothetical protein
MSGSAKTDQFWQPATFVERGVAVPFTTPAMAGARARGAARGVELIVPHPAGVRGVYIMTCSEVVNFCAATLHDVRLADRLAGLSSISPREMRAVARHVAAEGLAGRAVRQAAAAATEAKRTERLMANIALLQMLVQQQSGGACPMTDLDKRAKAAILRLSPGLGRPPETITNDIEALAGLLAPIGLGAAVERARQPRLLRAIADLVEDMSGIERDGVTQAGLGAGLIVSAAEATLAVAGHCMADARARAEDLASLLASWASDAESVRALLTRPDWLLDGWEQICLVWQLSRDSNRRACLTEMALMVPMLPHEAEAWLGAAVDDGDRQRLRKLVHSFEDWRTGSVVFDLVARNERVRALAA